MQNEDGPIGPNVIWAAVAAGVVLLAGMKYWQASAPPGEPLAMLRTQDQTGTTSTRIIERDCKGHQDRIWVATSDFAECIAYVIAKAPQPGDTAVLFFNGDVPLDQRGNEHSEATRETEQKLANRLAAKFSTTTIILGRPGLMGSTGFHQAGGMREDAYIMNMAVDVLRDKLSLRRLAMAGQSGGARLIAQMMILRRNDIVCAAMASGAYDTPRRTSGSTVSTNIWGQPGRRYLVPMHDAETIPQARDRRNFIIGDPNDETAEFSEQKAWSEKLAVLGHHSVLIEGRGNGPKHHGLAGAALAAAAACANGRSDTEIKALVAAE